MTDNRIAGLVLALSVLAVVCFLAARDMVRAVPTTVAVETLESVDPPRVPKVEAGPPAEVRAPSGKLAFPVRGHEGRLRDNFHEERGKRRHEALDIMAPRGTPVIAVDDGRVAKLYRSGSGGLAIYQFDTAQQRVYYYAHLDRYAGGIVEGLAVKRGDVVGFVGSTGNAPEHAPHLHFAIFELGGERRWWKGRAVNPYPYLK